MYYPLYYVIRYRRSVVRRNLTESFPERSHQEIVHIEKRFYLFFMDMIMEAIKLITISPDEIKSRVRFENIQMVNQVLREGKPVACFMGHHGNWEWMTSVGLWLNDDAQCVQVYRQLRNQAVDSIMRHVRQRMGCVCVEMHKTARYVTQRVAEGKNCLYAFIADQSPKRREVKHFTQFLNHSVPVLIGPEKIARHYDCEPIFVAVRRERRGHYVCRIVPLHDRHGSDSEYGLTDTYYQYLEEEIRRQPECYLWTHNRFKYARK